MKNYNILQNYPVSLATKPKRSLSLLYTSSLTPLNPWFITGFADGESTFSVSIVKDNRLRTGQQVQPHFAINLHIKDLELLNRIQSFCSWCRRYLD